ncbi:hypothetical protein D5S17_09205 [Pseudonocardiaceae bacterium YIM PH 21723]|nr:hypothetical protein D5S17_09205 [Pseudonocardiaceae bacterium YIM PH 21723]
MTIDPFADTAPETTPDTPAPPPTLPAGVREAAARPQAGPLTGRLVRVTLKGGTGYDAPWITIDGVSVQDALDQISGGDAEVTKRLLDQVAKIGKYFASTGNGASSSPAAASSGGTPAYQQAPGGEKRYCAHGEMVFRSGVSAKTGKPYSLFGCPTPNKAEQCKAQFLN